MLPHFGGRSATMVRMETPICDFGQPAIDFNLPGVDGRNWNLADCRGENGRTPKACW